VKLLRQSSIEQRSTHMKNMRRRALIAAVVAGSMGGGALGATVISAASSGAASTTTATSSEAPTNGYPGPPPGAGTSGGRFVPNENPAHEKGESAQREAQENAGQFPTVP
jgi:hypothetical protein